MRQAGRGPLEQPPKRWAWHVVGNYSGWCANESARPGGSAPPELSPPESSCRNVSRGLHTFLSTVVLYTPNDWAVPFGNSAQAVSCCLVFDTIVSHHGPPTHMLPPVASDPRSSFSVTQGVSWHLLCIEYRSNGRTAYKYYHKRSVLSIRRDRRYTQSTQSRL